jgi:hypothetical protein
MNDLAEHKNNQVCPGCGYPAYAGHSSQCPIVNNPRENAVTNLVLEDTKDFEELNAATLQEGEQKFTAALIKALEKQEAEEKPLGIGSQSLVQRLKEAKGLVVKRLMFGKKLLGQGNLSPEQYFNFKKEEYDLVKKYFGSDFTPYTEFVEVDTNFKSPHPDTIPGHEYIMAQEELGGEDFSFQYGAEHDFDKKKITPRLRKNLIEFVQRYEEMQKGAKTVIEDQVRVDYDKGNIFIYDTDYLASFENLTNGNAYLNYLGADASEIKDVRSLMKFLGNKVPDLANLNNISDAELTEAIPLTETSEFFDGWSRIQKKLNAEGKTKDDSLKILRGFAMLVTAIDYFPPAGDNAFLKRFKKAFHLDEDVSPE